MKHPLSLLAVLLWAATLPVFCQNTLEAGPLPQLNWRFLDQDRWTADLAFSTEWNVLNRAGNKWADPQFRLQVINLQLGVAYQLTTDLNLAAGYQLSLRDLDEDQTDLENRLLQQLTYSNFLGKYRLRGRVRTEQRLFRQEARVIHRWRMRPSLDFPLQGDRLDPGETYLNVQSEWLFNLSQAQPLEYRETRPYLGLGWQLKNGARLENGLEWRVRRADPEGNQRSRLFLRVTFSWQ